MAVLNKIYSIAALGFVLAGLLISHAQAAEMIRLQEQKIKAGLFYNFIKYTSWPEDSFTKINEPFQICLLGGDPFEGALDPLQGRTAQQRTINIKKITDVRLLGNCHIVFIKKNEADNISAVFNNLKGHILTISDIEGFSDMGGMVEFSKSSNRIRLRINKAAIEHANLHIEEQLLNLAEP